MNQRLPGAVVVGSGAALFVAVAVGTSCVLPTYTETGAASSSAASTSSGGLGSSSSTGGSGTGGSGGGAPPATALWQQKTNQMNDEAHANGVAVTPKGEILVTGAGSRFDFGANCMALQPERLSYVAHLNGANGLCLSMLPYGVTSGESKSITAGHDEAAYFGGWFTQSLTIVNTVTTLGGSTSPFVAKEGNWVVGSTNVNTIGAPLRTNAVAARQTDSYVFATGQLASPVAFGGNLVGVSGSDQVFVMRMEPSTGMVNWVSTYGDGNVVNSAHGNGIAIDASGAEFVVGDFSGSVKMGGTTLTSELTGSDIFVTKLDTGGNVLWAKQFGGPLAQVAIADVAVGGDVIVTGTWKGAITFGGTVLEQGSGGPGCFVARLDQDGNPRWAVGFPTTDLAHSITPAGIAADASGNLFVTGSFTGTADFGGTPLTDAGKGDVFLVKLDKDGKVLWSRRYGDASIQSGSGVAVGPDGNVVLTGSFYSSLDFGLETPLTGSTMFEQAFVVKLTP
jgi:hypothetical protein